MELKLNLIDILRGIHQAQFIHGWLILEFKRKCHLTHHQYKKFREEMYCQTSNIICTLVGYKIVDHSYVVGTLAVDIAPTTSSFPT